MSLTPIVVDMEVAESNQQFEMELAEEISVVTGGGTDVSDTTAVEADVKEGKIFHKANGDRAVGTLAEVTEAPLKDVNLIDYDGTCLYSYTLAEFANLTELPAAPTHDGLVSEGWMYTLAQAKTQAASDGKLYVGHLYNTTDGRTRIKIRLTEGRLSPYLGLYINGTATVDWGDGSATSTVTGSSLTTVINTQHTYAIAGEYTIYLSVNGTARISGNASYGQLLWANETASSTRSKNAVYMSAIVEVNIGDDMQIGSSSFNMAYHAKVSYPSADVFATKAFGFGLTFYEIPIICLPYGLDEIGNYGVYNPSVKTAQIPNTVTSLGTSVFNGCYGLSSLIIPSSVTSIGATCFQNCYGLGEIHFKSTTPPTVSASTAFTNLPTDCVIYVPSGSLSAYTSATNYPSSSTYTYVEE